MFMQPISSAWFDDAETADGDQQRVGQDVVQEQLRIVLVPNHVSSKRANAKGNGEQQPKYEQLRERRRQGRPEAKYLPDQHESEPENK